MPGTTTVRQSRGVRVALLLGYPVTGAVVLTLLVLAVEWFAQVSSSFDGVAGVAGHVGEPVALVLGAVLGAAAGAIWGGSALGESLRAVVGDRALTLTWDDARVSVPRALVRTVVLDGDLVLVGPGGVDLARVRSTLARRDLAAALRRHGYPAPTPTDPFAADFVRWHPGTPELGTQEHRLLAARAEALTIDAAGDAELLRRQLAARGVMVREVDRAGRDRVQEWRRAEPGRRLTPPGVEDTERTDADRVRAGQTRAGQPRAGQPRAEVRGGQGRGGDAHVVVA